MRWCCAIFEGLVEFQGQRGLSAIVANIEGDRFVLQGRAVDAGVQHGHTDVLVSVVEQQVIFHCPGCGVDLLKFYAKVLGTLRREDLVLR
jgi:hypothetical protein